MTDTIEAEELRKLRVQAAYQLARSIRRQQLTQIAIGYGIEPGPAAQLVALALETERLTGGSAEAFIETTSRLAFAEPARTRWINLDGPQYRNRAFNAWLRAWNACRHAATLARQVLLRQK